LHTRDAPALVVQLTPEANPKPRLLEASDAPQLPPHFCQFPFVFLRIFTDAAQNIGDGDKRLTNLEAGLQRNSKRFGCPRDSDPDNLLQRQVKGWMAEFSGFVFFSN